MSRKTTVQEALPGFWKMARRFWPFMRSERKLLAASLLALFAEIGLRLLEPWPLKLVFDRVFSTGSQAVSTGVPLLDAIDQSTLLIVCAIGVVAITGVRAMVAYANTVGFAVAGNRVLAQVRSHLYNHLQRLSLNFHSRARSGDLVVRVISDVNQLKDVTVTALVPLVAHLLILVGMVLLMLLLNWQLTLVALGTLPLFWLFTTRMTRRIGEAARKQRRREGAMAATAAESIGAIKIVQALTLEDTLAGSFMSQNSESLKQDARASKLSAGLERTVDLLIAISTGAVLWYGATLVVNKSITPGDLLVFLTYLKSAFKPVRDFAKYTGRLAKATAAGERVLDILEREPDVQDRPGAVPAPAFRGGIAFRDVSFEYEPGHPVLRDVSVNVRPGQRVALVGPSGNGKSTLLSLVLRLYDPTSGSVEIDGSDLRAYKLQSVRSQVSVVMQDTILFAASARDNIAYGAPGGSDEEIEAAARLANAHDFIMALPDGYDTVLGERGSTLSNGQRQRISIARAAIRKAPILILDEPTTGLDEENERAVLDALRKLMEGRTTFIVTHKLSQVRDADLILLLQEGRIVAQGTHDDLMATSPLYSRLYAGDRAEEPVGPSAESREARAGEVIAVARPRDEAQPLASRDLASGRGVQRVSSEARAGGASLKPARSRVPQAVLTTLVLAALLLFAAVVQAGGGLGRDSAPVPTPDGARQIESLQALTGTSNVEGRRVITFSGALTGSVSLAWAPDATTLALGTLDGPVRLLDTQSGAVKVLKGHSAGVFELAWSPDGKKLATGGWDEVVRLWSSDGAYLSTLQGGEGPITGLRWQRDGGLGAVTTNLGVLMWDGSGRFSSAQGVTREFLNVTGWSPDGSSFATGSNDRSVRIWSSSGKLLATLMGHEGDVYAVAWSPDGKMLASGSSDHTVRLWSAGGEPTAVLQGHTSFVNSLAWSPDGKTIASAGDNSLRLWPSEGGAGSTLPHPGRMVLFVAWSPDGDRIASVSVSADSKGTEVWVWDLGRQD